jgi:hypothetical protein
LLVTSTATILAPRCHGEESSTASIVSVDAVR